MYVRSKTAPLKKKAPKSTPSTSWTNTKYAYCKATAAHKQGEKLLDKKWKSYNIKEEKAGKGAKCKKWHRVMLTETAGVGTTPPKPKKCSPLWKKNAPCGNVKYSNCDYPKTYITKIDIDLSSFKLALTWKNPTGLSSLPSSYRIAPGAGKCGVNCNKGSESRKSGTLCTPKGGPFPVKQKSRCSLGSTSWAKYPTFFQRSGIAIHGNSSKAALGSSKSHGCVRVDSKNAAIIQGNSVVKKTKISVSGTWTSSKCFKSLKDNKGKKRIKFGK